MTSVCGTKMSQSEFKKGEPMNIIFMLLLGCADTTKVEEKLSAIETKLSNLETKLGEPKERVIVEYKIIHQVCRGTGQSSWKCRSDGLAKQVNKLINEGWQPLGGASDEYSGYLQAMVKYE